MTDASLTGEVLVFPPLVSYNTQKDFNAALATSACVEHSDVSACERLVRAGLPPIASPTTMALLLGISPRLITAMAFFPDKYYREFRIRKKSGGKRILHAPRAFLKTVQRFILSSVLETRQIPPNITGFVKYRSIIDNAKPHVAAKYVLNIDLKDFFASVHTPTVTRLYNDMGFSAPMANVLAKLCTYKNSLPQGAPTSPYLANLAFLKADASIERLCKKLSVKYTRYADDLTFSRATKIPKSFLEDIRAIVRRSHFELNEKKTRHSRPGQAKYVTGLVVNQKIQPDRQRRRKIRAMFHLASTNPSAMKSRQHELMGWASFVNSYNRALGTRYLRIAHSIQETAVS